MNVIAGKTEDNGQFKEFSLEDGLTDPNSQVRAITRALANGWLHKMQDWVNAEMEAPGGPPVAIAALEQVFVQTLASIIGQIADDEDLEKARDLIIGHLRRDFIRHARQIAAMAKAGTS